MANDFNKDSQKRLNTIRQEETLQKNISAILLEGIDLRFKHGRAAKEMVATIGQEHDISTKLNAIYTEKEKIIRASNGQLSVANIMMLETLDTSEKLLKKAQKRADVSEQLKEGLDGIKDELLGSLGPAGDLVATLIKSGPAIAGMALLAMAVTWLISAVKRSIELNQSMGMSAASAGKLEANIQSASWSMEGLLYSTDELRESAMNLVEATGRIDIPKQLIIDATRLGKLLDNPEAGVALARTLKNAGIDSGELTDQVTAMADSMGQDAGPAMEMLVAHQMQLGSLTNKEILALTKKGLLIKQQGIEISKINGMLSEAVDIEGSMKAAMKLRIMSGKSINFNAMTQAKLQQDGPGLARAMNAEIAKMGPEFETNHRMQKLMADGLGVSVEEMMKMRNSTAEQTKLDEELLKIKKEMGFDTKEEAQAYLTKEKNTTSLIDKMAKYKFYILGAGAALVILYGLAKAGALGAVGDGIAKFVSKFGTAEVLMGAAAMLVVAASVLVFAGAMKVMADVPVEALYMAIGGMLALVAAVALLGSIMASGVGAVVILGGALAMVIVAAAVLVLAHALVVMSKAIPNFLLLIEVLPELALGLLMLYPVMPVFALLAVGLILLGQGLLVAAVGFAVFGVAMLPLAVGLSVITPIMESFGQTFISLLSQIPPIITQIAAGFKTMFDSVSMDAINGLLLLGPALVGISLGLLGVGTIGLPGLMAITGLASVALVLAPALTEIGNLISGVKSAESNSTASKGGNSDSKALLNELKGLRSDIQSQPILISVDGKVVSRITRLQAQQGSMRPPS